MKNKHTNILKLIYFGLIMYFIFMLVMYRLRQVKYIFIIAFIFLFLIWFVLPRPVHCHIVLGVKTHFTLVTLVVEHGWEMLGLHMIPCVTPCLVRKLVTQRAVEFRISWIFSNKLEEVTGVLKH